MKPYDAIFHQMRTLRRAGTSWVIALDPDWIKSRGLKAGDPLAVYYRSDEVIVQLAPPQEAEP